MAKKFLNRKISAEDEWSHITNTQNPNINDVDVMDVQDRTLFFNDEAQEPQTNWEKTKEATRNAMDKAGNTGQYIKYVNAHFEKKNSEINKIKALKNKFDQEVDLLRQSNNVERFNHNNPSQFINDKSKLFELKESIQKEHLVTKAYLNELKSSISKTESELERQSNEMRSIDEKLKNSSANDDVKMIQSINEEINSLSQKYDAKTMLDILKSLEESLGKEEIKNANK